MRKKGYDPNEVLKSAYINKAVKELKYHSLDDFYTQISQGGTILGKAATLIISLFKEQKKAEEEKSKNELAAIETKPVSKHTKSRYNDAGVKVKGVDNLLVRVSKCCSPVPGDQIIGYITKGRGVSVHRVDCPNIVNLPESEKARFIEVEWSGGEKAISYNTDISIIAEDRKGMFADISRTCEDMDVHIAGVNARSDKDNVVHMTMTLALSDTGEIQKVLRNLKNIHGVIDVYRSN